MAPHSIRPSLNYYSYLLVKAFDTGSIYFQVPVLCCACGNSEMLLTVDRQMYPRPVATGSIVRVVSSCTIQKHHGTLVPALVRRPQVRYLYRRLLDEADAPLVCAVYVWRIAVKLDEHRDLRVS